jgi:serine/threonine protein kinase
VKLSSHPEKSLSEGNVRTWISKVVDGVSYLHSQNIIHRSLMPLNVLLSSNEVDIKLVGSSFAKINNTREDSASGVEPSFEGKKQKQ